MTTTTSSDDEDRPNNKLWGSCQSFVGDAPRGSGSAYSKEAAREKKKSGDDESEEKQSEDMKAGEK